MGRRLGLLSGFLILAGSLSAYAQSSSSVDEIVVTARGTNESIRDIPVAITVMDEKKLQNYGVVSFDDIAQVDPTVSLARGASGNGGTIFMRGIGPTFSSIGIEQSVAVIVDGVYYPNGRVINEGTFDMKQVSILKGPQALFFGKNATAGVISLETNNPGDTVERIIRSSYEVEQEQFSVEGIFSAPLSDKLGMRLAIRTLDSNDGYMKNTAVADTYTTRDAANGNAVAVLNNPTRSDAYWPGEENSYARLTLDYQATDRLSLNLKLAMGDYETNSSTGGRERGVCNALNGVPHTVVNGAPVAAAGEECNKDWAKAENQIPAEIAAMNSRMGAFGGHLGEDFESTGMTLSAKYEGDTHDFLAVLNYHENETNWVGDYDGGGITATFAGEHNEMDNTAIEVRMNSKSDGPLNYVLGAYYQDMERSFLQDVLFAGARNSADPAHEYVAYDKDSATDNKTVSVYGELRYDVSDATQVTYGVRYIEEDKDSYFTQHYVNPNFAGLFFQGTITADQSFDETVSEFTVRHELNDQVSIYGAYKEGYKSGGFSNSGILGVISGSVEDFTFKPESVDGFEAGLKGSFLNNSLTVAAEVFSYEYKDLQLDFFNAPVFAYVTYNAGSADTEGAEIQVNYSPESSPGLTLMGSVAYLKSQYGTFIAPCNAGQSTAQGCTILQAGQVPKQNLSGYDRPMAPDFSGSLGFDYETAVSGDTYFGLAANYIYKGDHSISELGAPGGTQEAYGTLDAALRVGNYAQGWQFSIIGKNLTDEYAGQWTRDQPGSGGGTGTANAFPADLEISPIEPRTLTMQVSYNF